MDTDEGDYVFFGTPIEREEDITTSRRKKSIAESAGHLRTLPSWKQEVRDEDGRRRFHGAFTGGFSAGYYNTVGSKEGWTPQSFTSSRKNRAQVKEQSILNFLDDDEKTELEGNSMGSSSQFDTFGFTATEIARKQAEKEQQQRPSIIPGPIPDELVLPVTESIGVKLLLKMGWRRGHSIKDSHNNSLYDARREARKAFLALSSDDSKAQRDDYEQVKSDIETELDLPIDNDAQSSQSIPVYALNPKQDLHGLGFDPFKHAPEFKEKKCSRMSGSKERQTKALSLKDNLFAFKSRNIAPGFGIGALEELDVEDQDVYAFGGYDFEDRYVQDIEEPSGVSMHHKPPLTYKEKGVLLGFKTASNAVSQLESFDPPVIPKDFVPHHKFPHPLVAVGEVEDSAPPEAPPPEDNNLRVLIEGVATLVTRCGKLFEDLSREKNQSNPLFCFLEGGNGHDYYARKLWEERQKRNNQTKQQANEKSSQRSQKLSAESRGKMLGERPLESNSKESTSSAASADLGQLQYNLSETFTKPACHNELPVIAKHFKDDPAKQERFELFLKEKYQGGLRSFISGSSLSEDARARERLDFEAAAEVIERGKLSKDLSTHEFNGLLTTSNMQFTSGGEEHVELLQAEDPTTKKLYPKRDQFQWRPSPILCKRFDIMDPFMGKPPLPRLKSKMDSLVFTLESVTAPETKARAVATRQPSSVSLNDVQEINTEVLSEKEVEALEVENVERPVDLYKAIFSDDSDGEETRPGSNLAEDPQKKAEAASSTLNRLIAGDFLESLGKELGLELPPEAAFSKRKAETTTPQDSFNGNRGNINTPPVENKDSSTPSSVFASSSVRKGRLPQSKLLYPDVAEQCVVQTEPVSYEYRSGNDKADQMNQKTEKVTTLSGCHKRPSRSLSSEDERSINQSKWRRNRSISSSDSDSSLDFRERYSSKSKGRKKESSRERSRSSRKHSKKHRRHK